MTEEADELRPRQVVERYFAAMRQGRQAEDEMMALFADDARYVEPFSGLGAAIGKEAIRERLRAGWDTPLPDFELDVLSISISADEATVTWECRSSAFDGARRGRDEYTIVGNLIASLVVVLEAPVQ